MVRYKKTCTCCKATKTADKFSMHPNTLDGLQSRCKLCIQKRAKKWNKDNPEEHNEDVRNWIKRNPEAVKIHQYRQKVKRRAKSASTKVQRAQA